MTDLWRLSAEAIAAAVRSGEISALEVLDECLRHTQEVEPGVGAYLEIFEEESRAAAAGIDQKRRDGEALGALAGVPVALKDNLSLEGHSCTCASKVLQGYRAAFTATAVSRLETAGAIFLGKTNLDEFAMGSSCENSALQLTRNPWDPERVPGGSSGGSAAAVAAGSVPLALGSDTGGSIRQPAAFCGVVGLKPTYGRVSRYGLVAFASSLDQIGPLSHCVRDAAVGLAAIAGPDSADASCSVNPVDDYLASIEDGIDGLRVGVIREIDIENLASSVRSDWEASLERLSTAGARLQEVSIPHLHSTVAVYYVIANSEASANLARFDGVRYGHRSANAGSLLDLYEQSREEGFGSEVKRRILLGTFALSSGYYDAYYGRARGVQLELRKQFREAFEHVDVVVSPTCPSAAFAVGEKADDPLEMYQQDIFTTAANLAGLPAVAVPSGLDDRGLPLSLQITGRAFDEAVVLRVARSFERVREVDFESPLARKDAA
jgi:aspartyl-tRNA(Asn)/glutamyl-tRNA(Gln) amidotransferase subunit A